jgi:ABC-type nitrate/sulfonate/bicarbonate transport system ATPase subunit
VEEAVLLSDRVVVMTAGPGRIEEDIKLELARPRDITAVEFNSVRRDITQYLTSHVSTKVHA